jgi:hypothetical protein
MKTKIFIMLLTLSVGTLFSQQNYDFASIGQQKLLVNPAFCASSDGLNVQTLAAFHSGIFANYTGASYSVKGLGIGISNTVFTEKYTGYQYYERYTSNQTSLSLAFKIKLGSRVSLIPSLQGSFSNITQRSPFTTVNSTIGSFSSGLVMDINKILTLGAAFYDMLSSEPGAYYPSLTKVFHASLLLFKDKKVNFQPYALTKLYGSDEGYFEGGAYTSYKIFSLQTAFRIGDISTGGLTAGLHVHLAKMRFGYTYCTNNSFFTSGGGWHELFFSISLGKGSKNVRNLMLN